MDPHARQVWQGRTSVRGVGDYVREARPRIFAEADGRIDPPPRKLRVWQDGDQRTGAVVGVNRGIVSTSTRPPPTYRQANEHSEEHRRPLR